MDSYGIYAKLIQIMHVVFDLANVQSENLETRGKGNTGKPHINYWLFCLPNHLTLRGFRPQISGSVGSSPGLEERP